VAGRRRSVSHGGIGDTDDCPFLRPRGPFGSVRSGPLSGTRAAGVRYRYLPL